MARSSGVVRGFFIALAVSIGLPVALVGLALTSPDMAMVYAYVLAPQLAYLFPAFLSAETSAHAPLLSLLQMILFSLAVGLITAERRAWSQLGWVVAMLAGWWLVWRLAGFVFGLYPEFTVRM